jgi:hypothetical protein
MAKEFRESSVTVAIYEHPSNLSSCLRWTFRISLALPGGFSNKITDCTGFSSADEARAEAELAMASIRAAFRKAKVARGGRFPPSP